MSDARFNLGFVGTGSMGSMLVRAFLRCQIVRVENVWLANRTSPKLEMLAAEFPGVHCGTADRVAQESQILFIAVKPGDTENVLAAIEHKLHSHQLCVFLTNVFSFEQLENRIPCAVAKLIPTVTQQVNQGAALLAYDHRSSSEHAQQLEKLLARTCKLLKINEDQFRLFADITSCGPALLALCIDELCRQALAIDPTLSSVDLTTACVETLAATAQLLRTGMSPHQLISEVAVPGGMTEAGINALRKLLPQLFVSLFSATRQAEQQKRLTLLL